MGIACYVGHGQGTGNPAQKQHGPVNQPFGYAAAAHEQTCQHKEGHGQKCKAVNAADNLLGRDKHSKSGCQEHNDGQQ